MVELIADTLQKLCHIITDSMNVFMRFVFNWCQPNFSKTWSF